MTLASHMPPRWNAALHPVLASPGFAALEAFLRHEVEAGHQVLPPPAQVFAALAHTPPDAVKVVLLGQDPYPTAGNANGLAFSVRPGVKLPGSLRNLFAGLHADLGVAMPKGGDLSPWAERGVLLLNTVLTVREGDAGSHRGHGWEAVTEAVVRHVASLPGPVVFLCFGKHAQQLVAPLVDVRRHPVLEAPHPSPLNGRKFVEAVTAQRHFTRVNDLLARAGRGPIDWSLG